MKRVRSVVEPRLTALGFAFAGTGRGSHSWSRWIEFSRPGLVLRCQLDVPVRRLFAEALDDLGEYKIIAEVELGVLRSPEQIRQRAALFAGRLYEALRDTSDQTPQTDCGQEV